ncbi:MAG: DVUA0089 family protein, partial [Planctomycetota bacterium]
TGDDTIIPIAAANLTQPSSERVRIVLDNPLSEEVYRLTIVGTGADPIRNLTGDPLNGGSDELHQFDIIPAPGPLESNDILTEASDTGIVGGGYATFSAYIGDGYYGAQDVDLFVLEAGANTRIIADINADQNGSSLDSILRLFDAAGNELAVDDDTDGYDSYIDVAGLTAGIYYVGVSGYDNFYYDPHVAPTGFAGSVGEYDLIITVVADGEIRGSKWNDRNGDGVWDAGEEPLADWKIYVDADGNGQWDAAEIFDMTDANGNYVLTDLPPNTYIIAEVPQAGWKQTYPDNTVAATESTTNAPGSVIGDLDDSDTIELMIIDSSPIPPVGVSQYIVNEMPLSAVTLSEVPTSSWTYGCSATSAGMIFGYYDRTGYSNMYTGPTNGGVAPLYHLGQGIEATPIPGSISIIATQNGFDGSSTNGHVDDYWISSDSGGPDPWEGNWTEHTPEGCTADFMGTNQWKWDYDPWGAPDGTVDSNIDGATSLFSYNSGTALYDYIPPAECGSPQTALSHGLRLFAESRGYTVLENYTQKTDNQYPDGFTFADYMAEIDAGYPVMLQVVGHTMVGVGYDQATQTVYMHDTWGDYVASMTWGGSYSGMELFAVTVIHLDNPPPAGTHTVVLGSGEIIENIDFGGTQVAGRSVFYNNSVWDGYDPGANASDDNAIDLSKTPLMAGQTASFANYISYVNGINGIMVDIVQVSGTPTAADFATKVGNDNDPSSWAAGPTPLSVTVRAGEGAGGTDRVTLIFSDTDAYNSNWVELTVLPTANTGLVSPDVFYYGLAIGDTGNSATDAVVDASDRLGCRANLNPGFPTPEPITSPYDFNRDGAVDASDRLIARAHITGFLTALNLITVPPQQASSAVAGATTITHAAAYPEGTQPSGVSDPGIQTAPAAEQEQQSIFTESTVGELRIASANLSEPLAVSIRNLATKPAVISRANSKPALPLPLQDDPLQIDVLNVLGQPL